MSDEMKDLLAFISTLVVGLAGSGVMFGMTLARAELPWIFVGALAVIAMAVALGCAVRWLHIRRVWEEENYGPVFSEIFD